LELKNKTKKELITIAKSLGLRGYSSKNKDELIKIIENSIGTNENINDNGFFKKYIDGYLRVIAIIVASVFTIALGIVQCYPKNIIHEKSIRPLFSNSNDTFNILILPFYPDKECLIENTQYENSILQRIKNKKSEERLKLNVEFSENYKCPSELDVVERIAIKENANFVIWGEYDEECESPTKVRIKYAISDSIYTFQSKSGESDYAELKNIEQLKQGYLQEDIDYIIGLLLSLYESKNHNYSKATDILSNLTTSKCDSIIKRELAIQYYLNEKYEASDSIFSELETCYKSNPYYSYMRGVIRSKNGNYLEALPFYKNSIKEDSSYFGGLRNTLMCLIELERTEEAVDLINYLVHNQWADKDILSMKAQFAYKHGLFGSAIVDLESILDHYPNDFNTLELIGLCYREIENNLEARKYAYLMYQYYPDSIKSYLKVVGINLIMGKLDSANYYANEGLAKFPNDTILLKAVNEEYE